MRVDASLSRSPVGAIITELFSGSEGKTLSAVVASIKGEMMLLVFNQKTALKARAEEPLLLKEGQRVDLVVLSVTDEEIQMSIVDDCTGESHRIMLTVKRPSQAKQMAQDPAMSLKGTEDKAVKVLNDSTVDSVAVRSAVKEIEGIIRHKERLLSLDGVEVEELLSMPLKKLYDLAAAMKMKGRGPHKGMNASNGLEKRDVWLLDELKGVKPEDIARLVRLDREVNLFNLIIAKTVRESKDFIKPLLRELMRYYEAHTADKEVRTAELKDGGDRAVVEKFEYGKVIEGVRESAMAKEMRGTVLKVMAEKASRLTRAFASKDCFILPLLYNGECEEALALIRKGNRNKASCREGSQQADVELVVRLSHLGEVRVVLSLVGREVALGFFAERKDTFRLIDENKGILVKRAGEKGYNIAAVSISELKREFFHLGDTIIDLRV